MDARLIGDALEEIEDESGAGPGSDELPSKSMTRQHEGGEAPGGHDERDWVPVHDWSQARRYKGWLLMSREGERCIAVHDSDPSGGLHLLPHGFAHMGLEATVLHTCAGGGCTGAADFGPVGVPRRADAICQFPRGDRGDFPANATVWRPLAQLATCDIDRLRIERAILVKGERIDPINLTCEGYGQICWRSEPKLPPGLTFSRVDGNSCQITGTPESSSEDSVPYKLTAYNRLGQSRTEVTIMVMDPPHDLRCAPEPRIICPFGIKPTGFSSRCPRTLLYSTPRPSTISLLASFSRPLPSSLSPYLPSPHSLIPLPLSALISTLSPYLPSTLIHLPLSALISFSHPPYPHP